MGESSSSICNINLKKAKDLTNYQLIWAILGKYPAWPGILLDRTVWASHWPSLPKNVPKGKVLVFWFGTGNVSYMKKINVYDYCANFDQFFNPKGLATYHRAVAEANSVIMTLKDCDFTTDSFSLIAQQLKSFKNIVLPGDDWMNFILLNLPSMQKKSTKSPNKRKQCDLVQCCYCSKEFEKTSLMEHMTSMHFGFRYQCNKCKEKFCSRFLCIQHSEKCSPSNSNSWSCIRFPKMANADWSEFLNSQSFRNEEDTIISEEYSPVIEEEGIITLSEEGEPMLSETCTACQLRFESQKVLITHMLSSPDCLNSAEVCVYDCSEIIGR